MIESSLVEIAPSPRPRPRITHATPDLPAWRRCCIRIIESLTGAHRLEARLDDFRARHRGRDAFWQDLASALGLSVRLHPSAGADDATSAHPIDPVGPVPASGGLLVVANHPFGIVDGVAIAATIARRREDLKVIVWNVFEGSPECEGHLLGLDLTESSRAALRQNLAVRREASDHLRTGGAVLLFPAGGIEISDRPFGPARERPWHRLAARLARAGGAAVLPVFVAGHDGRLFHAASHLGDTVRRSLCLRELVSRLDSPVDLVLGRIVDRASIAALGDDAAVLEHLRARTLALGGVHAGGPSDGVRAAGVESRARGGVAFRD